MRDKVAGEEDQVRLRGGHAVHGIGEVRQRQMAVDVKVADVCDAQIGAAPVGTRTSYLGGSARSVVVIGLPPRDARVPCATGGVPRHAGG